MEEDSAQGKAVKQANLEKLSKEEIISKYKNLLGILKKAKAAKDDAIAEIDKLKSEEAKVIRELEDERNKAEKEAEALREMVTNLTENKMAIVTKNESLQRQLNVQLVEVDSLKNIEKKLLQERDSVLEEAARHKKIIAEQQNIIKELQKERESAKALSNKVLENEKLMDKVESLEAQVSQIKLLKTECKKIEEEKGILAKRLKEAEEARKAVVEDKKAMEIINNELKSQKIILDEKLKTFELERQEWQNKVSENNYIKEKLSAAEKVLQQNKQELETACNSKNDLEMKYEGSLEKIKVLEDELCDLKEQQLDLNTLHKKLSVNQEDFQNKLGEKEKKCGQLEMQVEDLERQLKNLSDCSANSVELQKMCDTLQSKNANLSSGFEELKPEFNKLKEFYDSIYSIINSEGHQITKDDVIMEIQKMNSTRNEITSSYDTLKEDTLKLMSLVKCLFLKNINDSENLETNDVLINIKVFIQNLESFNENLKPTYFEHICNKCFNDVKEFCQDLQKLETLFSSSSNPEFILDSIDNLLTEKIVVQPLFNIMNNLLDISSTTSQLFGFSAPTEMASDINLAHNKIEPIMHLTLNTYKDNISIKAEAHNLRNVIETQKEAIKEKSTKIEEHNDIIQSFDFDLKALKQKYNESEHAKSLQEKAFLDLTKKYKEMEALQKQNKDNFEENEEKLQNLENQLTSSSEILKEKQEKITLLETQLMEASKSNEYLKNDVTNITAELDSLIKENKLLKEEISSVRSKLEEVSSKESSTSHSENESINLESVVSENKLLMDEILSIKNELAESIKYAESQAQVAITIKAELESVMKIKESLHEELSLLKSKMIDSNELIDSQSSYIEKMKTDLEALTQANKLLSEELLSVKDEFGKQLKQSETSCDELEQIKSDLESEVQENKFLKEEISLTRNELAEVAKQAENAKTEYKSAVTTNELLNKDLLLLKTKLSDSENLCESQCTEMESIKTDLKSLKEANNLLTQELLSTKENLIKIKEDDESHCRELEMIRTNLESVTKENLCLKEEISSFKSELAESVKYGELKTIETKQIMTEFEIVKKSNESLEETLSSLKSHSTDSIKLAESHCKEIESLTTDKQSLTEANKLLSEELLSVKKELSEYIECSKQQCSEVEKITKHLQETGQENELLKKNITTLQNELADSIKCQEYFRELLQKTKHKLQDVKAESESLKSAADVKMKESNEESVSILEDTAPPKVEKEEICQQEASICAESMVRDKPSVNDEGLRYKEIILELNEMNQIIRKRGEKISLLEDTIQKQNSESQTLTDQLKELQMKLSSGEKLLASKQEELKKIQSTPSKDSSLAPLEQKIHVLEEENLNLKKMLKNDASIPCSYDTQSETMSTSTFSKFEDTQRMKELEDTFEERYMKLKSLAIQLKKKLAEQTSKVKVLEESKQKLSAEKEELVKKGSGLASRNIQVLQNEIDRLQDSLDSNAKEMREREKQLVASAQECADLKSKLVNVEEENHGLNQKIKDLEEMLASREQCVSSLEEQVCTLEKKIKLEEEKIVKLQNEQRRLEEKAEAEKKNTDHLLRELEESKQESKKHSLIDLEMKDYERSIDELTSQVNEKDDMISDVTSRLENEVKKTEAFKEEVTLLRDQTESETNRAEELKKNVSDYKRRLSEMRQNQEQQMQEKEKDKIANEKLIQELEDQKLAVAELTAHSSQMETKLCREIEIAEAKVDTLEEKLTKSNKTIQTLQLELGSIQKDYDAYKIRAQSVLRQKAKVPQVNYEQVKTEREQLNASLETAQIATQQLQMDLAAAKETIMVLSNEKESLSSQLNATLSEISKKEYAHQDAISSLERKLETKIAEYQNVISTMSSQNENIIKSYKAQLDSLKENHLKEIKKWEKKLEERDDKVWRLKNSHMTAASVSCSNGKSVGKQDMAGRLSPLATHHIKKTGQGGGQEEHRIDITNMIREEGEGSEWVEPHSQRSPSQHLYNPPSLEQLINSSFPSQPQLVDESSSIVSAATEYSSKEVAKLESKLSTCEVRIQQLTTLLAETESENAKLIQLSDTLKDDIRRTARNEEREKHLENNEYIKNVILKFLYLKIGDERYRLVPVLKTLLQLSPEETSKLTVIAKGEDSQGLPQQGWGNYLHLWSGR